MEIREVEKRFDAKLKSYDPSKRVGADSSFNPDRFVEVKEENFNPEVRVNQGGEFNPDKFIEVSESERVESEDSNKLDDTLFIMKLISVLYQFGNVEVSGTNDGRITAIDFSTGDEYTLHADLTDVKSVKVGEDKHLNDVSAAGVLELALYIVSKYNYAIRKMRKENK